MKKNLLYLWALICSVSLLTACSSDDDNTVNDETIDMRIKSELIEW